MVKISIQYIMGDILGKLNVGCSSKNAVIKLLIFKFCS